MAIQIRSRSSLKRIYPLSRILSRINFIEKQAKIQNRSPSHVTLVRSHVRVSSIMGNGVRFSLGAGGKRDTRTPPPAGAPSIQNLLCNPPSIFGFTPIDPCNSNLQKIMTIPIVNQFMCQVLCLIAEMGLINYLETLNG